MFPVNSLERWLTDMKRVLEAEGFIGFVATAQAHAPVCPGV